MYFICENRDIFLHILCGEKSRKWLKEFGGELRWREKNPSMILACMFIGLQWREDEKEESGIKIYFQTP